MQQYVKRKSEFVANQRKIALNEAWQFIRARFAAFLGKSHDGNRDLYAAFGYKRAVTPLDLYALYTRQDIAHRIIKAFSQATWRDIPIIRDEAGDSIETDADNFSQFAHDVDEFLEKFHVIRYFERADRLASIGRYGLLFMGFAKGKPHEPLNDGKNELLFLAPYSEIGVSINAWQSDPTSPRFGMPEYYTIQNISLDQGTSTPTKSMRVHYSRVIHIAEILDQDEVYGIPRLLPVVNRLQDLEKVVGGSAETFWLTANRGVALWADKDAQLDEDQIKTAKDQLEAFAHGMQRTLSGQGMNAQVLGSESPDPAPNADKLLSLIAGAVGMPTRIMLGTERGQLASGQDENNWASRIGERRRTFATPAILRPFIDLMIRTGNIPEPDGQWWPKWADTDTLPPDQRATIALSKTNALANYARTPGIDQIVPPAEFRVTFLELPPESEYTIPEPAPLPEGTVTGGPGGTPGDPSPQAGGAAGDPPVANMAPKSMYVSRRVLNPKAIKDWAKAQGIAITTDQDLHVTICYSRRHVDWMQFMPARYDEDEDGKLMIHPGGPRAVEVFGQAQDKVLVLSFQDATLQWRHQQFIDGGASSDYLAYQPHVTLGPYTGNKELSDIEPYTGAIALGPEIFEEIVE